MGVCSDNCFETTKKRKKKNKTKIEEEYIIQEGNSSLEDEPADQRKKIKSVFINQSSKSTSLFPEEDIAFPKGERFYQLKKDSNIINTTEKDSLSEKVELYFSLDNVCNPTEQHSFSISIINNKHIGIQTFLGNLENASGEKIDFGNSFCIDFF